MEIDQVVFTETLPKLDLHGYDRDSARIEINDFIEDNFKMGNQLLLIVHGIGTGIIRQTTIETLNKNKKVIEFKSAYNNRGSMIVKIEYKK